MATQVWSNAFDKIGDLLAITDDTVAHYDMSGSNAVRRVAETRAALLAGQDPAGVVAKEAKIVPLAAIETVELAGRTITCHASHGGKPIKIRFGTDKREDAPKVLQALVQGAAKPLIERNEPVGLFEALRLPVALAVVAGWLWGVLYYVTRTTETGNDQDLNRQKRGIGQLILLVSDTFGSRGAIGIGVVLLVGFLGWIALRIAKRPTKQVWAAPTG